MPHDRFDIPATMTSVKAVLRSVVPLVSAVAIVAGSRAEESAWHPAKGPLMTQWAAQVTPTNAHSEYPRPQLFRSDWLNLNGLWDYAITVGISNPPASFQGKILVPFPIDSALSGVMQRLDETNGLWYRRLVIY